MSVRGMAALVAGLGSGYLKASERRRQEDIEDEDRKYLMSERTRALNLRDELGRAGAEVKPVEVKQDRPDSMDDRDVGAVGEAPLPTAGYDVAGKRFATMAEATKAASEANTPQAVSARLSDVLLRSGDPVKAQQLRAASMQERLGNFQLSDAERTHATNLMSDKIDKDVVDWASYLKFVGNALGSEVKLVPSADGKTQEVNKVLSDGTLQPTGKIYGVGPEGFAMAKEFLKSMPAEKAITLLHANAQLAETGRHNKEAEDIARDKTAANIEIAQIRADAAAERRAAAAKAAGAKPSGLDMDAADKFINALFMSKDDTTGAHTFNPKGADAVRGLVPRMPAAQGGDTQGAVNQALTIYQTALKNAGGDHDKAVAMIRQATAPKPQQAVQPSIPTTAKPTSGAVTMTGRVAAAADPLADDKRWVMNKLMTGPFDSDAKLAEIARSNANPKFRAAAAELLKERRQRAENFGEEVQSQPL